ncbi:MAG: hypothetical protein JWM41_4066 [Gemmatimonadetes bacterium]|nr:hypothetical protein [Gemmatimonadota bacterium]
MKGHRYDSVPAATTGIARYLTLYNTLRPQSRLNDRSPRRRVRWLTSGDRRILVPLADPLSQPAQAVQRTGATSHCRTRVRRVSVMHGGGALELFNCATSAWSRSAASSIVNAVVSMMGRPRRLARSRRRAAQFSIRAVANSGWPRDPRRRAARTSSAQSKRIACGCHDVPAPRRTRYSGAFERRGLRLGRRRRESECPQKRVKRGLSLRELPAAVAYAPQNATRVTRVTR